MKFISKGESPRVFEEWKAKATDDWKPTYKNLRNPEKRVLHAALLAEQGSVCCYCGRSVDMASSHIEHFRPQEPFDHLALEYRNLHASCYRMPAPEATHCGHFKADKFDEEMHISPLDLACETRFIYTANGDVASSDVADKQATYMAEILGLSAAFLRNAREEVLKVFDPEFLATATREDFATLSAAFRARNAEGHLSSYGHVVARFAEQYVGELPE